MPLRTAAKQRQQQQQHAADLVLERRLRPIYEMLDSRNLKGALKLINGLMQKPGGDHPQIKVRRQGGPITWKMEIILSHLSVSHYRRLFSVNHAHIAILPFACLECSHEFCIPQVLRALVLERLGKPEEALALCREVKESGAADERTLLDLATIFSALHCGNGSNMNALHHPPIII